MSQTQHSGRIFLLVYFIWL